MKWASFHHPDFSFPVVKRKISLELLELLEFVGEVSTQGGWALINRSCYPNRTAYNDAVYRLRKSGLLVTERGGGKTPRIKITEDGTNSLASFIRPEKRWNRKWNTLWYILMYDVPESDRSYRNTLRRFLHSHRMGCLQKSVWITPTDIRPEFDDLTKAAAISDFAYLFEAKTVLGLPSEVVVSDAWNFTALNQVQERFITVYEENLNRIQSETLIPFEDVIRLATEEMNAYRSALVNDPLLPKSLWPKNYRGKEVVSIHRKLSNELRHHILQSN